MPEPPALSVVVPAYDEVGALPDLLAELDAALEAVPGSHELIFVDDGSGDGTGEYLEGLAAERADVIAVRLPRNGGKSAALAAGFDRGSGAQVVTLDADG